MNFIKLATLSEGMQKRILFFILLFTVVGALATFAFYNLVMNIPVGYNFSKNAPPADNKQEKEIIYFGVISRYPPNIIFKGYQPIMDYLSEETGYHFELKLSSSYEETVRQLEKGEVAAAFFGSFLYIKAHKTSGIIPILKPLNEFKEPFFRSVIVARTDSKINSIKDLKHKKIAVPSKESFSGNWLINYEFNREGFRLSDFDTVQNFAHHHSVVYQVLKGNYDAGVVKEIVAKEFLNRGLKIIAFSDEIPGSPIVAPVNYNPEVIRRIKKAFLNIDADDKKTKERLKSWDKEFVNGFVEAKDEDYNQMRKLSKYND